MGYYSYPLDAQTLLRKKLKLKKELLMQNAAWVEKRVAVLGGSTTNEVVDQLELALLNYGIKADFYQSEYGKYWEDGVFGNEKLNSFQPDIIYIYTNWRNIQQFPSVEDKPEDVANLLDKELERFESMWASLRKKFSCPIIQNNFDRPNYRLLGNRDIWDYRGKSNFIFNLNYKLYQYAQKESEFYINDIDYIAQEYGLTLWNDPVYWSMYKYACPMNAIPYVSFSVANIIKSIYGKNKKLLALDLDNTLWGGIVGDDGVEGIVIGAESSKGQIYRDFQTYCKELKQIGVVLAVNSKNDEKNALDGLNHPYGILRPDDFVSIKANWKTKDQNIREISEELALGIDSFVFVDDNPAEREIVYKQIPCLSVPAMDGAENYIKILDHSGYFEVTSLSNEDLIKTSQYKARKQLQQTQASFDKYEDYLKSLEMRAIITEFEPMTIQRVAQLTNKTNQFNLTTLRCSEADISHMQNNPDYVCLCARLIDRFTDNGIVSVVSGEIINSVLHIRLWLMSCRVLKRDLEVLMMNEVVKKAREKDVSKICGYYFPTSKNEMVKDFYKKMGFELKSEDDTGNCVWMLDINFYEEKKVEIVTE